jgi:drug/metabolite transporter (DMT)-like permease
VGATFSAIPFALFAFALLVLPASMGSLLNAATPMFTALVSVAWIGERLSPRAVVGMGVGIVAVLVLVGWSPLPAEAGTLIAVGAALLAPLSYAIGGTFIRRHLPDVGGLELATGQLTIGALLLLPAAIASGPPGTPSLDGLLSLLAIGTFSTALAWPLYFRVMSHTTPMAASTVTFIVPAFGIAWGAFVLGEPVGPELIIGFALVVVSLVLVLGLPVPGMGALRSRLSGDTPRPVPRATPAS